jgi:fido (protein-threonine AMPylation protein)
MRSLCVTSCSDFQKFIDCKGVSCSKREKICKLFEHRHHEIFFEYCGRQLTLLEAIRHRVTLSKNSTLLNRRVTNGFYNEIDTPKEFIALLLELHRSLYSGVASCPSYGRFRIDEEIVEVDRGNHKFAGAHPSEIETRLTSLWRYISSKYNKADTTQKLQKYQLFS